MPRCRRRYAPGSPRRNPRHRRTRRPRSAARSPSAAVRPARPPASVSHRRSVARFPPCSRPRLGRRARKRQGVRWTAVDLRIVADDLTGALDTAAPFAAARGPLPVLLGSGRGRRQLRARYRDARAARPAFGWVGHLHGAGLAFKKIDSLLRGRTTREIAACLQSGLFRSAIIAPAFPAQDRITRMGRQYWRPAEQAAWQPVDLDLLLELRRSLPIVHAKSAKALAASGFFLCDAETEEQLLRSSTPASGWRRRCCGAAARDLPAPWPAPRGRAEPSRPRRRC